MPEFDANNNMVWPLPFAQPTMNRATGSAVSDASQIPWLIGIDGRSRGTLEPFPGMGEVGFPPTYYSNTITVTNYAWVGSTTVTLGGVTVTRNLVLSGSNNTAAADLAADINALTATYAFLSASAAGPVVTIVWNTGGGNGPPTYSTGGSAVTAVPALTAMTAQFDASSTSTYTAKFAKYLTMRLSTGTLLRGFVVQKDDGQLVYVYKYGVGGEMFTDYITIAGSTQNLKVNVTGGGRVAYIVGSSLTSPGTGISKVLTSGSNAAGSLLQVYDMATDGGTSTIGEAYGGATTGTTGALTAGYYLFAYRYYDSIRRRYSPLSTSLLYPSVFADNDRVQIGNNLNAGINTPDPFLPRTNTKGPWDYVEFFSSVSNGDPTTKYGNQPLISRGVKALSNDYWTWGTAYQFGTAGGDDYLTDASLLYAGTPWAATTDYVNTTQPVLEDIVFFGGSNFGLEPENELLNIRWSPLHRIEPENFPPLNTRRTNIPSNGAAHFVQAGDFLWLLGDGESYRIQKVGSQLSIFRMLEGVSVVGCRASVTVGGDIYTLTTQGLIQINAETGDYTQVSAVDRMVLKRWANNLEDEAPNEPCIFLTHDAHLGVVTVYNKRTGEAIQLWLTTGRVTMLVDMWYEYAFTGKVPNEAGNGNLTILLTKIGDGSITRSTGGLFLRFLEQRTASPNMMGIDTNSGAGLIGGLMLQPTAAVVAGGNTAIRFTAANSGFSRYTHRGRFTGGVLYNLTASPVTHYKIIDSEYTAGTPGYIELVVEGDRSAEFSPLQTNVPVCSICPIVMAAMFPPLSGMYAGDMLSRRQTSFYDAVISKSTNSIETSTDCLLEYYAVRMNDSGDEEILAYVAPGSEMLFPANGLPWTKQGTPFVSSFPIVKAGVETSLDTSTPNQVWAEVLADGGVLYPAFRWCRSGQWVALLGLFVFGRVNPNQRVEAV